MAGDTQATLVHYRAAANRTTSLPEQRYLATRAARLKVEAQVSRGPTRPAPPAGLVTWEAQLCVSAGKKGAVRAGSEVSRPARFEAALDEVVDSLAEPFEHLVRALPS